MPDQIIGYYTERKQKLLEDFDRIGESIKPSLARRYGKELATTLQREAREQYENLIPEIPYIKGFRAKMLNMFLVGTAQEVALYKAMNKHDKSPGEAWELCHEALRSLLAETPKWKIWLLRHFMFSGFMRKILSRRARKRQRVSLGDFEIEYLIGRGDDFDFGVNYLHCGNIEFVKKHGAEEFAPYVCMSDIVLGEALGWGLTRTQTLADGCAHCDFRFKKGAPTHISSKTPEVQKTIERIRSNEAQKHLSK